MLNRSCKYIEDSRVIADSLLFLQNAKKEKEELINKLNEYLQIVNSNYSIFLKFPVLLKEIQSALTFNQFNTSTAQQKTGELKTMLIKLSYMHDMLNDIEEIENPVLRQKVSLDVYKVRFINAANNLLYGSVDTLFFEMQQFEQLFKKTVLQLNDYKEKCEKLRSLINQDMPLISGFAIVSLELQKIAGGETSGNIGADHVINNYTSIRENLGKLSEFSKYFSKLSKDYMLILDGYDLQIFQTIKNSISLNSLSGDFLKLNSKATEYKSKMIKLDSLRNHCTGLRKEINEKTGDLSPNHQNYVRNEMIKVQELLFNNPGRDFEKAESKILMIREVLKKEFKSRDQRSVDALYLRQSIAKYENDIWQEELTTLFEELNNFVNGSSHWTKDEFINAIQKYIKERNEILEAIKVQFELYFSKNREYKNRFEKIANTKSPKKELDDLVREMNSFKPLKNIFYKFIK